MVLSNENSTEQQQLLYYPKKRISENAYVKSMSDYRIQYQHSIDNPVDFWFEIAKQFHWHTPINKDRFWSYNLDVRKGPVYLKCFEGATTNMCYNLLDRNIELGFGDKIAFYWEGNDPKNEDKITYKQLHQEVCKFANVLKSKGVVKGDRVAIYMPMILEIIVVILACTRIGAIHSVVFAGFSAAALADRILDGKCKILVTADGFYRGEKLVRLQSTGDAAVNLAEEQGFQVSNSIVVRHLQKLTESDQQCEVVWREDRDVWYHEEMEHAASSCDPEWLSAEDPLFMLYTSGSTGKPKGVLHTIGGYLVFAATTFKYAFDYKPEDVYWCTADAGWITCHTYVIYGPLANGATSVMFEGTPYYPAVDRLWAIIEKYKVNQFYTAPTAIRALMRYGEEHPQKHDLSSLKILGSVGEPINPEAWLWYHKYIGREQCSIVDTFFQTETGGHVITPLPGCTPTKPGSATLPFFGIIPELLDENGDKIEGEGEGYLVFGKPWPGMMRTVFGDQKRFEETYFSRFPGYYCSGDGARRDADGYLWITGRIDDKLNVSGHLLSTADVESCLTQHSSIMEAAVVARPHALKGECLYCFVTPKKGVQFSKQLVSELNSIVREKIGSFAVPDIIHHAPGLPKTRSGKIMRRILRKIAVNDRKVGETSTLIDESIVETLFQNRPESDILNC